MKKQILLLLFLISTNCYAENWKYYLHYETSEEKSDVTQLGHPDNIFSIFYDEDSYRKSNNDITFNVRFLSTPLVTKAFIKNNVVYSKQVWEKYNSGYLPIFMTTEIAKKTYKNEEYKDWVLNLISFEVTLKNEKSLPIFMDGLIKIDCKNNTVFSPKLNVYDIYQKLIHTEIKDSTYKPSQITKGSVQEAFKIKYCK